MKNKFIRVMSLILVSILLLGVGAPVASAESMPFVDVPPGAWFYDAVEWAYIHGLAQGTSPTTFSPNANITRGQFVTFLYRLEAEPPVDDSIRFNDVANPAQYFFNAVNWAFANGIVTGIGDGLFAPHRNITREEMAVILFRFARLYNEDTTAPATALFHFPDRNNVSGFALEGVRWAANRGILRGDNLRRLNPRANATRAEAITVIQRYIFNEEFIPPVVIPPPFPSESHFVQKVDGFPAPNRFPNRNGWIPDMIVIHTTAVNSSGAIQAAFGGTPPNRTSYHFVVDRHGTITQLVPITDGSWANGTTVDSSNSSFIWSANETIRSRNTNANFYTVSIGFGDAGPQASASSPWIGTNGRITEAQINAGAWLIEHIRYEIWENYGITIPIDRNTVIGHNEVTPRTTGQPPGGCPGVEFPFNTILSRVRQP
jgi:N-acetyl-anhydromuramyl-L-alanine amidase AmpD